MRPFACVLVGLWVGCSSTKTTTTGPTGSDASTGGDGSAKDDAASGGSDAGGDALPQGRDGGGPGEACTSKDECREYACLCGGQRVLRAGCLPAGICMSQSEVCGGLGCTPTR